MSRTRKMRPKATASTQRPLVRVRTMVSVTASRTDPRTTPPVEPTPPRMMQAKALMSRVSPLSGVMAPRV
jgi:hypothetical protein